MKMWIKESRKAFWHLRRGGLSAFRHKLNNSGPSRPSTVGASDDVRAQVSKRGGNRRLVRFPAVSATTVSPRRPDLKVAVILDDFSLEAFKYEWHQVPLGRHTWEQQLGNSKPDILFVESAWAGNFGEWRYQLSGKHGVKDEFRRLLATCRDLNIPTIFWNKEDPPHYTDFIEAAALFDYVFTSDSDRVTDYVRDLGHDRIAVMQFAAQPALHNPVRPRYGWHERDIAFAGMYFAHKYPERRQQMEMLLPAALNAGKKMKSGLEIFSRHANADAKYRFPNPYGKKVVGSLTYAEMLNAYKAYKIFLNVNSVVDSPSMCARRIFEITAAGTSVISTPSRALAELWQPNEQFIVKDRSEAEDVISAIYRNPGLSDRQLHLAQRRIWHEHTYANRVEQIVNAVSPLREHSRDAKTVSVLVSSIRPGQLEDVYRTVGSFVGVKLELVLATHGFNPDPAYLKDLGQKHGVLSVVHLTPSKDTPLGTCLRNCVEASSGYYLSKMDDDDFYGPSYLIDLIHALMYSGADITGKQAHYMYLAGRDATILRFADREHRFTSAVMGPTLTGRRSVFEEHPFSDLRSGEDTAFLKSVQEAGGTIYSSDRFNYSQYRGSNEHTWKVPEDRLLTTGDLSFFGPPENHILI